MRRCPDNSQSIGADFFDFQNLFFNSFPAGSRSKFGKILKPIEPAQSKRLAVEQKLIIQDLNIVETNF